MGLAADVPADQPTTDGVIAALERHDLIGRRVGVQLYPRNANERLLKFLGGAGAQGDPVLPYVYASEVDDARVIAVIAEMASGGMDAIAFTSAPRFDGSAMSHAPSVRSGAAAGFGTHRRRGGRAYCCS